MHQHKIRFIVVNNTKTRRNVSKMKPLTLKTTINPIKRVERKLILPKIHRFIDLPFPQHR